MILICVHKIPAHRYNRGDVAAHEASAIALSALGYFRMTEMMRSGSGNTSHVRSMRSELLGLQRLESRWTSLASGEQEQVTHARQCQWRGPHVAAPSASPPWSSTMSSARARWQLGARCQSCCHSDYYRLVMIVHGY